MNRDITITQTDVVLRRNDRPIELTQAAAEVVTVGVAGPQGAQGPQGPQGASGVAAATDPIVYTSGTQTVSANSTSLRTIARQSSINPLRRWQQAFADARYGLTYGLGAASARNADVLIIGDSITEGFGSSPTGAGTPTYVRRFAQLLAETANTDGRTGVYIPCSVFDGFIPEPKWVSAGTVLEGPNGLGLRRQSISSGGSMTITVTGTSAVVFYREQKVFPANQGAIRIRAYQGTGVGGTLLFDKTRDTYNAALSSGGQIMVAQTIPVAAWGTRGPVTIKVEQAVASDGKNGSVVCDGMYVHDGTETQGVRVWCSGKSGSKFSTWTDLVDPILNTDWLSIMRTHTSYADATAPPVTNINVGYLNPTLVIIALGTNESTSSATDIQNYMETIVSNINDTPGAYNTLPSFVFMVPPTNFAKTDAYWSPIITAMYEKAEQLGCAIWDWSALFGSYSSATGDPYGWSADYVHPSNPGHVALGDFAAREALSGVSSVTAVEGFAGSISATAPATFDSNTRTVGVTVGTTGSSVAAGNDSRLSDARTPIVHATTHQTGGTDPLTATNVGAIPLRWKAGTYVRTPMGTTAVGATGLSKDRSFCTGLYVPRGGAIDRVGLEITVVGGAGSVTRIGLYADNNGVPGSLLFDAGTVDTATSTGFVQATVNWTGLDDGLYWVATVPQVGTAPTVRSMSTPAAGFAPYRPTSISNNPDAWGVYGQNMAGALASTFTFVATIGPPLVLIRCA